MNLHQYNTQLFIGDGGWSRPDQGVGTQDYKKINHFRLSLTSKAGKLGNVIDSKWIQESKQFQESSIYLICIN